MHRRLALTTAALLTFAAPAARAAQAPGRIVLAPISAKAVRNVDARGAGPAVALPDGGVVLAGGGQSTAVTQLRPDGAPDPSFGSGGTARVRMPGPRFSLLQMLRRPDGRLLLVGTTPAVSKSELSRLAVVGLSAQGALDPAFGQGGVARLAVQGGCDNCSPAALQPDGSLVLAGATGQIPPESNTPDHETPPKPGLGLRWVVARLTPAGAPDAGFGEDGVATVPVGASPNTAGYGVGVTTAGRLLTLGRGANSDLVTALTPAGAADPAYRGGVPVPVSLDSIELHVDPTGGVDVIGGNRMLRLTAAGKPDAAFGEGGTTTYGELSRGFAPQVLRTADGGLLVAAVGSRDGRRASQPALRILRVTPGGEHGATVSVNPGFGGGFASPHQSTRVAPGLDQDGFLPGTLVQRPDGSFVLAGGVSVVRYTGEGQGSSIGLFAAAALTPALRLDRTFGGPPAPARFRVSVPLQRANRKAELRRILVRVTASGPGLALLRVRDGRRRVLAQSLEPLYAAGSVTVRIPLTAAGRSVLRRGRSVRVSVGYAFRDVLTSTTDGARIVRLR